MTTSGTYTFNRTRDQIVRAALRKVGAIAAGETPGAQLTKDTADQLNALVKHWMTSGIHIWTTTEAILFTGYNQACYPLGTGSPTNCKTILSTLVFTQDQNPGDVVVHVNNTFQVSNGATYGIVLDDGTTQWTTVDSFDANASTINIHDPLQDYVTIGNESYITTQDIVRPLRISDARRWDTLSQVETSMIRMSRQEYQNLPNKNALGTVTQFWYDPQGGANTLGMLYLWPTPSQTINNNVKFTFDRPIQDFDTAANTPDLPVEWINALTWNLALQMAVEFGVNAETYMMIKEQASICLEDCRGWDREPESTYFGVDFNRMGS